MAKFDRVNNYKKWSKEKTLQKIEEVELEIKEQHRMVAEYNSFIAQINERKSIFQKRISNKQKYLNQLKLQLEKYS